MNNPCSRKEESPAGKCATAEETKKNYGKAAWILVFIAGGIVVPFLLWFSIVWLDASDWALPHIRSDGGIGIWFGFWGSYFGCVASVVIAAYTIRINRAAQIAQKKQDASRQEQAKASKDLLQQLNDLQLRSVIVSSLPDSEGIDVWMHDFYRGPFDTWKQVPDNIKLLIDDWLRELPTTEELGLLVVVHFKKSILPYISLNVQNAKVDFWPTGGRKNDPVVLKTGSPVFFRHQGETFFLFFPCSKPEFRAVSEFCDSKEYSAGARPFRITLNWCYKHRLLENPNGNTLQIAMRVDGESEDIRRQSTIQAVAYDDLR